MSDASGQEDDLMSMETIAKYAKMIEDKRAGLDPEITRVWFDKIIRDARELAPDNLKDTIEVIQDDLLPMKYNVKASKRAVPFLVEAIEKDLQKMPYATGLYFKVVVEAALWDEYERYSRQSPSS